VYLHRVRSIPPQPAKEDVDEVSEIRIGGQIAGRIYRPASSRHDGGVIHYVHGGGWVLGTLDMHDGTCRALANRTSCMVVATTYRLAPEHPFPAAADDVFAALQWVAQNGRAWGWDSSKLVIAGSSAGGNLVASTCLRARDQGGPPIALQVLIYPVLDSSQPTRSYKNNATGYFLSSTQMAWYWDKYMSRAEDRQNPYASPRHASHLRNLPPTVIVTAEHDPLCDEGEAYGRRLIADGGRAMHYRAIGQIHGFLTMLGLIDDAAHFVGVIADEIVKELRIILE
jgi:acetyl esterase